MILGRTVAGMSRDSYDVIIVGGATAGLSGALTLARARRSVLVLDAGEPRNSPADGVHGLLSRDGIAPADLVRAGTDDGLEATARRLLVTTGVIDELPDIAGLRGRWGRDVLHCPYCHGWEVRDQLIGVLGTAPFGVHQALLFRQGGPEQRVAIAGGVCQT